MIKKMIMKKNNVIEKEYIQHLLSLDNLKYLRDKNLITENEYKYAIVRFKNLHNRKK